jgi:hypothetical protein
VRLSHLSEAERRAYVIADNKLALNAGWDREMLAIELQGLVDLDVEIELTGFSLAEVDTFWTRRGRAQLMVRTPRLRTRSLPIDTRVPRLRSQGTFGCSGVTNSFCGVRAKQALMRRFSAMKPST